MNTVVEFLEELELFGKSYNYINGTRLTLRDFARSCKGENATESDVPVDATEDDVKKWIKDMMERGLCERSRIRSITVLQRFFVFLMESPKYKLQYNPVSRIAKQLPKPNKQTQRPIKSLEEISEMVRHISLARDRAMAVLLAKTGIRAGELSALDVEDVDFENRILRVDKHICNFCSLAIAKGRKNRVESMVPLDDETLQVLKVYLVMRQQCNTNALFISGRGNRMPVGEVSRIIKNWAVKIGMCKNSNKTEEKITPHFFRAWITYQLQINGCNPIIIDAIRGDKASNMRTFYANQVLPFEEIRREYERTVPKFGI
ncbi:MAG: tyrosine-type recombinase/integrase (plasmid) [Candidatus Methanoperedens sp.]|nr:MAG: tyrosine-type recombinase/integrase [Candidatus Methanoperedens sp.]